MSVFLPAAPLPPPSPERPEAPRLRAAVARARGSASPSGETRATPAPPVRPARTRPHTLFARRPPLGDAPLKRGAETGRTNVSRGRARVTWRHACFWMNRPLISTQSPLKSFHHGQLRYSQTDAGLVSFWVYTCVGVPGCPVPNVKILSASINKQRNRRGLSRLRDRPQLRLRADKHQAAEPKAKSL